MKILFAIILLSSALTIKAQIRQGKFIGYEQRPFSVDSMGEIHYYPTSLIPWVYEVVCTLSGDKIELRKRPFYINDKGIRVFADTLTNTYLYNGKFQNLGASNLAVIKLQKGCSGYLYLNGKWLKEANNYFDDFRTTKSAYNPDHALHQFEDGKFPVFKSFVQTEIAISFSPTGLFINGNYFRRL